MNAARRPLDGRPVSARRDSSRFRALSLLAAGSLVVHELTHASSPAAEHHLAHGYIPLAATVIALILFVAIGCFVRDLLIARRGTTHESAGRSFRSLWLLSSGWLATVYLVQERLETMAVGDHELAATALTGEWLPFVLAVVVGALVALALRGAHTALSLVARRRYSRRGGLSIIRQPQQQSFRLRFGVLAWHLAGRGPPLTSG